MNDTFISIKKAIRQIDVAFSTNDNVGVIGYIMRKCKLLDLPLYQIDDEPHQVKQVNPIVSDLFYGYLGEKYPPKPQAKEIKSDLFSAINPLIRTYTEEPFEMSDYFWHIDEFKQKTHDVFAIANAPVITISQPSQDIQELNAQIQNLQQQLKEKDEQIKSLTSQLQEQQVNLSVCNESHEYFAPDLAHAVRLWIDTYGNGKNKNDSHTNLANQWIKANTKYDQHDNKYTRVESRIREITTPLQDYGKERLKEK